MPHHHLTEIGKYRVEELLGEGAMGVVYRALDPVLNRHVAIKVMSDALAQDTDLRERFLREARLAGSLQHPNVITIYDFGEVEGHPYIAMEYVEGADLEELLRKNTPLSIDSALDLIIGVLQGLSYAHKRGIVHRDIKPANIRVDEEGNARIMDFGVAHLASSKMTRTGMMMGTPSYMAPEQITGEEITPRADIFAVGAVLYELLTRTRPFQADTLHAVLYNILSVTPPALDKVLPGLPPALNGVVMRALQKEPEDRYASALDMANELTLIRSSLSERSEPRTLSLRASIETALADRRAARLKAEQRGHIVLAASISLASISLGLVAYGLLTRDRTGSGPRPTEPPAAIAQGSPQGRALAAPRPADPGPAARSPSDSVAPAPIPTAASTVIQQAPPTARQPSSAPGRSARPSSQALDTALALTRAVQRAAMDGRRRASDAGATAEQLRSGDEHLRNADALIRSGKLPEAAGELSLAAVAFSDAERAARPAASAAAPGSGTSGPVPPPSPVSVTATPAQQKAPSSTTAPTAVSATVQSQPTAPRTAPAPNPAAEIAAVVAAYARAIDDKDLAELRRIRPSMTEQERRGFQDFFTSTRSLHAALSVANLQADSASAEAQVTGFYEYVTSTGRNDRDAVSFHAVFRREAGGWKIVAVR